MKYIIIFAILLCSGLVSCNALPAEDQMLRAQIVEAVSAVRNKPVGDSIVIDMNSIAKFQWDTLYVFSATTTVQGISEAIGTTWPGAENVSEDDNLMIFMEKRHIKKYIFFKGFNYQKESIFIKFVGHADRGELFTPSNAKFLVVRDIHPPHLINVFFSLHKKPVRRPGYNESNIHFPVI